jgi:hypothetical protein
MGEVPGSDSERPSYQASDLVFQPMCLVRAVDLALNQSVLPVVRDAATLEVQAACVVTGKIGARTIKSYNCRLAMACGGVDCESPGLLTDAQRLADKPERDPFREL